MCLGKFLKNILGEHYCQELEKLLIPTLQELGMNKIEGAKGVFGSNYVVFAKDKTAIQIICSERGREEGGVVFYISKSFGTPYESWSGLSIEITCEELRNIENAQSKIATLRKEIRRIAII